MGLFNLRYITKMQKPQRVEALSDGVFAIVMTILVLELALEAGEGSLAEKLGHLGLDLFQYFMTFIILGSMWLIHYYQFYYIKRVNSILMWLNILYLATIALFPFTYSIMLTGTNPITTPEDKHTALLFYAGNMVIAYLLLTIHWWYATSKNRLVEKSLPREKVTIMSVLVIFGIFTGVITLGLSFFDVVISLSLFGILGLIYLGLIALLGLHVGEIKE